MSEKIALTQKQSRQELEKLLEEVGINFFAVDTTGKLVFQNNAMREYTDGKQDAKTIDPTAWADCQAVMANKTAQDIEEVHRGHTFRSFKRPVMDEHGNVLGVIGIALNITAQKAAENMKVHFINSTTPRFRLPYFNILNLISEYLSDHAEKFYSSAHYEMCLSVTQMAMRGLKDIDSLLNYAARLNQSMADYQPIELVPFCESLVDCYVFMARKAGVQLRIEVNDQLPRTVLSGQQDLTLLLSCLIDNAIKFREKESGEVCLTVEATGNTEAPMLLWRVQDDGIGIEAKHQKRIFDHFERVASKKCYPGIGLGLSKVKHCLERLNGMVEMTSEPGKGTCFSCTLPLIEEPLPAQPQRMAPHLHHVLLVEKDSILAHKTAIKLKNLKCDVEMTTQEARILNAAKQGQHDLLFISLTDESAQKIIRRIRDWETMHNKLPLPIIGLADQTVDISRLSSHLTADIQQVLSKPLSDKAALSALKTYCNKNTSLRKALSSDQPRKKTMQD